MGAMRSARKRLVIHVCGVAPGITAWECAAMGGVSSEKTVTMVILSILMDATRIAKLRQDTLVLEVQLLREILAGPFAEMG
jgi:hypothetical protein